MHKDKSIFNKSTRQSILTILVVLSSIAIQDCTQVGLERTRQTADSSAIFSFNFQRDEIEKRLGLQFESRYYTFRFSEKLNFDTLQAKSIEYDQFCDNVIRLLELSAPTEKIQCYIYSDESEAALTGFLHSGGGFALPKNEIHTFGYFALEHESAHILFNNAVCWPQSSFFSEGLRQFVEHKLYPHLLERDKDIAKRYLDQPIESWANGTKDFWESAKDDWITVSYPISGLFVRFLIDAHGLDKFKEFYRKLDISLSVDLENKFSDVYKTPLHNAIQHWKTLVQAW